MDFLLIFASNVLNWISLMVDYHEKRRIYVIPITVDLKNELANYMHGNRVFAKLLGMATYD